MYSELERKKCRQCKNEKSIDHFRKRLKGKSEHYESYCKLCEKDNQKKWNESHKEHIKLKDFKRNCIKYGMTHKEYGQRHADQNGTCASCMRPETSTRDGKVKRLAIDHCHVSGSVRGLLCQRCNIAFGQLDESPDLIQALLSYALKFKKLG
jgi:hypothetical protein